MLIPLYGYSLVKTLVMMLTMFGAGYMSYKLVRTKRSIAIVVLAFILSVLLAWAAGGSLSIFALAILDPNEAAILRGTLQSFGVAFWWSFFGGIGGLFLWLV